MPHTAEGGKGEAPHPESLGVAGNRTGPHVRYSVGTNILLVVTVGGWIDG